MFRMVTAPLARDPGPDLSQSPRLWAPGWAGLGPFRCRLGLAADPSLRWHIKQEAASASHSTQARTTGLPGLGGRAPSAHGALAWAAFTDGGCSPVTLTPREPYFLPRAAALPRPHPWLPGG